MSKVCNKCKIEKKIEDYHVKKSNCDGHNNTCGICKGKYRREHHRLNKKYDNYRSSLYYKNHIEQIKESSIKYREENKEKIKEVSRLYYIKNKEKIDTYNKAYSKTEKGRVSVRRSIRKYQKTDKGAAMARANSRKRLALKKNVNENFTYEDEKYIFNLFESKCFNCNLTLEEHIKQYKSVLQIDHLNCLRDGNALTLTNAVLLCRSCNCAKHTKTPKEFFTEEQLKILEEMGMGLV